MNSVFECAVCQVGGQTLRCARCQNVYYCSKEHQRLDWKRHKVNCQNRSKQHATDKTKTTAQKFDDNQNTTAITYEGSSENEILNSQTQVLSPNLDFRNSLTKSTSSVSAAMPPQNCADTLAKKSHNVVRDINTDMLFGQSESGQLKNRNVELVIDQICKNVIHDLETFGVCVVDNFLGIERGTVVLNEVLGMYKSGVFKDGQLVSSTGRQGDHKTIRGDQITWIDGHEKNCVHIGQLIREVDAVIMRANKMSTGRLAEYTINGRTKAMVACYPGSGAHYVKHVDNPNRDGRCVTAIYYLNRDWDAKRYGGLLRIFPEGSDKVADIEPLFDRLLFFWSDRTNPHEVQPSFQTRYAITLWYFDAQERDQACKRFQNSSTSKPTVNEARSEP